MSTFFLPTDPDSAPFFQRKHNPLYYQPEQRPHRRAICLIRRKARFRISFGSSYPRILDTSDCIRRVKDTRVGGAKGYTEPRLPTYEANSPSVRALLRLVVERIVLPLEER